MFTHFSANFCHENYTKSVTVYLVFSAQCSLMRFLGRNFQPRAMFELAWVEVSGLAVCRFIALPRTQNQPSILD